VPAFSFIFETLPASRRYHDAERGTTSWRVTGSRVGFGSFAPSLARELSTGTLFSTLAIEDTVTLINHAVALLFAVLQLDRVGRAARCARTC
jgi:hypothetical protein